MSWKESRRPSRMLPARSTALLLVLSAILAGCNLTKPSAEKQCGRFREFAGMYAQDLTLRQTQISIPLHVSDSSVERVDKVYGTDDELPPVVGKNEAERREALGESYFIQLSWPYFPITPNVVRCTRNDCWFETTPFISVRVRYRFVCEQGEWLLTDIDEQNGEIARRD